MSYAGFTPQSAAYLQDADPDGPELVIATTKSWKQRQAARERGAPRGRIPKGLCPRERMERRLLTKRGQALYRTRGQTVEPVFGQIKDPLLELFGAASQAGQRRRIVQAAPTLRSA